MAKKLTDITNTYSKFATNQVLTEVQLNEFLEYFDEQDRLSRICLSGVGIACGFELSTDENNNITITQGAGVTTDGDLIHLVAKKEVDKVVINSLVDSITYTHYRPYTDEKVEYHPHFNKNNSAKHFNIIPLVEIVSDDNIREGDKELRDYDDLEDKIALFYLECYENEPDKCVTVTCENQGVEQVNRLRVLLVDKEYLDRITRTDTLFNSYISVESYLEAKTVYVPRVVLNKTNTKNAASLALAYCDSQFFKRSIDDLTHGMAVILKRLGRDKELEAFYIGIDRIFSNNNYNKSNLILFQYKYDLLKDLADSYNELKELFLRIYATCCPNISAFPKHLLLGSPLASEKEEAESEAEKFAEVPNVIYNQESRHKFHKAPILLDTDEGNSRFDSVLTRILEMIGKNGYLKRTRFVEEPIKITPSNVRVPLGKRAVPFYYAFNNVLIKNWDFDKRNFQRYQSILGYRPSIYSAIPKVKNPFNFSIDPYDFYRIEGHQGKPYDDVFKKLKELKKSHSLPFDIKVLGINVSEFDELLAENFKCDFEDLGVLLKAWYEELICIAKEATKALSSFSTTTSGENLTVDEFFNFPANYLDPKTNDNDDIVVDEGPKTGEKTELEKFLIASDDSETVNNAKLELEKLILASGGEETATKADLELKKLMLASDDKETANSARLELEKLIIDSGDSEFVSKANLELDKLVVALDNETTINKAKLELANLILVAETKEAVDAEDSDRKIWPAIHPAHPILNTISIEPNTLGYFINLAITNSDGSYANVLNRAMKAIDAQTADWDRASYESMAKIPTQIVAACIALVDFTPTSITQLSVGNLKDYDDKIELLCEYTRQLTALLEYFSEHEVKISSRQIRTMISMVIDQLTNICCSSRKLKAIYAEVEKRKESVIERLDFAKFAENNPGLEHKAGVGPGQTFVLVYINKTIHRPKLHSGFGVNTGLAGFAGMAGVNPKIDTPTKLSKTAEEEKDLDAFAMSKFKFSASETAINSGHELAEEVFSVNDFYTIDDGFEILIERGAIIADFTLPYLCCSDCAPINFVLPKIPVSLDLSSNTYCIDDVNLEIDFVVSPQDGEVTVDGIVPGVNIIGNKIFIDGTIFPEELLGTKIKFKVDGEDTDAELLVSKKPDVGINIPDVGANRLVNFTVTGDDSPYFTYLWEFGDGNSSTDRNPTHDYSGSGSQQDFIVTLTVQGPGGICPTVITSPLFFENVMVDPLGDISVCEGAEPVVFLISPEGAFADIQGEGLNPEKTHFDPTLVGPGTYSFTFEGTSIGTITVNPKPAILSDIKPKVVDANQEFSIQATNVDTYKWTFKFPDGTQKTSVKEKPSYPLEEINKFAGAEISIAVVVTNGCGNASKELIWPVPELDEPTANLTDEVYCNEDDKVYPFNIENFTETTTIVGPGVDNSVSPPTFTPRNVNAGPHNFEIDGVVVDSILVVAKPTIEIKSVDATEKGFIAVAEVPAGVDASTLEWNFLHPESGEKLHAPISGVVSPTVNYGDFTTEDWTELNITLRAETVPCGPIFAQKTYTKPVDVLVELEKYNFCEGDTGVYPFSFTPDDGSVTVSGQGVNTIASTFNPGTLPPGPYILSASNGDKINVTIHAKSVIEPPVITEIENGIQATASLPAGTPPSSIVWTFVDVVSGETLHDPITGTENPSVNFNNFTNESWSSVKVIVTFDHSPCTGITNSEIYERPEEVDIIPSLPQDTFCEGDNGVYNFIFTPPNDGSVVMSGQGVNTAGTTFSPSGLPPSTYDLESTNGHTVTVTVVPKPVIEIGKIDTFNDGFTVSTVVPAGVAMTSLTWSFIDPETKRTLHTPFVGTNSISLNYQNFVDNDWTSVRIVLTGTAEDPCGSVGDNTTFTKPVVVTSCVDTMVADLTLIQTNAPSATNLSTTFEGNTVKVGEVLAIYALLNDLIAKPQDVLSGQLNDRIATEIEHFLKFLEAEILAAVERNQTIKVQRLLALYRMAVGIYATSFVCQDGVKFSDFSAGIKLNTLLRSHFDNKNQASLISLGLIVFDASNNAPFIAIINEKGSADEPWATIDFIIKAKRDNTPIG